MTGAQLLRFARVASGISQHELARRTGTHQPSIWAIENPAHDPTVGTLSRLVAGLGNQVTLLATLSLTAARAAASTPGPRL
jgi:transcriptional regulator with XRE-family HTH domain